MTVRRNRNPEPVEQAPAMTVADYYRMRLTQVPLDPTPASWEDYLRVSGAALYAAPRSLVNPLSGTATPDKQIPHTQDVLNYNFGIPWPKGVLKHADRRVACYIPARVGQRVYACRMPSSSTHLNLETARPSLDELVTEYDNWRGTLGYDTDEFSAITKLTALYRFAITHYDQPGAELLLDAIAAVEAAEKDS